jgi:hypothetical protein
MPLAKEQSGKKKKSPFLTFLSWTFDLFILAALIWYFSNPQNSAVFWSTAGNWFSCAVVEAVRTVKRVLPSNPDSAPETAPLPVSKPIPAPAGESPPPPVFIPPPLPTEEELAREVPGDCFPPELREVEDIPDAARLFYTPPPLPKLVKTRKGHGKPLQFSKSRKNGVPYYQVTIDLSDPDSYLVVRLPGKATQANSTTFTAGHENFESFLKRYPCAAMVNGTFFSKDDQERVMGNLVSEGKIMKYSQWENYGTTLSLRQGDYPEMVTARAEGRPKWDEHWFSLTCGPRLLKNGEVWVNPELEGFTDPHVLGCGSRAAIGFPKSRDRIYLITFLRGLSLAEEAKAMKAIGCWEAMNLDGGASKALFHDTVVMKPGRGLTNVLVVYDAAHKAPPEVIDSWRQFQEKQEGGFDNSQSGGR